MPVHKFITPQRSSNLRIVYAQKDMKIGWDPKMLSLGIEASIAQTPIFVSLPQELRHRRLGLINSIIAESCDDIIVSIGVISDASPQSTHKSHVLIQKGTPLCILMM